MFTDAWHGILPEAELDPYDAATDQATERLPDVWSAQRQLYC